MYMFAMSTENPRILITFDNVLLKRIDDFRFENRINSRSEAIRRLIEEGLKTSVPPKTKPPK
jgi:metal-responsive CopG/Arc/MetJ family transcriptional regulator